DQRDSLLRSRRHILTRVPSPRRSGERVREAGVRGLSSTHERPLIRPSATFSPLRRGEGTRS
ncbi:MAG: hypothetical protein ABIP63_10390, partial [Thermoanaerobaculia bacterium]